MEVKWRGEEKKKKDEEKKQQKTRSNECTDASRNPAAACLQAVSRCQSEWHV